MKLHTCSEVISLSREMEKESAAFYQDLASRFPQDKELFTSFADQNTKFIPQIERAYFGVITDAIEGCFAFDLETDEHKLDARLAKDANRAAAVKKAIELEAKMIRFYTQAAGQSKALMADVPRAFMLVVKKREQRLPRLESALKS